MFVPGRRDADRDRPGARRSAAVVKIFPASLLGGPAFIKSVAPSFPRRRFVPTGGVNPDNLAEYLALSSVLACGGTWICEPALLRDGRFDEIERRARDAVGCAGGGVNILAPASERSAASTSSRSAR